MNTSKRINDHIRRSVAACLIGLSALFIVAIHQTYDWGSDDTVLYFMGLEAQAYLKAGDEKNVTKETHCCRTVTSFENLPTNFQRAFAGKTLRAGELAIAPRGDEVLYLLPYRDFSSAQSPLFYVTHHYYEAADQFPVGISLLELSVLLAVCVFFLGLVLTSCITRPLSAPIQALFHWCNQLADHAAPKPDVHFQEFQAIANTIEQSIDALNTKNTSEKRFLQSLSHELRTPLAVTRAALELIKKHADEIPSGAAAKLEKIARANQTMNATSEALLWLWLDDVEARPKQTINLQQAVDNAMKQNQHLRLNKSLVLEQRIQEDTLYLPADLLHILLSNLLRNALQYSATGVIQVHFSEQRLSITNPLESKGIAQAEGQSEYGYGVGLYLVESLCKKMGWQLDVSRQHQQYRVTITF